MIDRYILETKRLLNEMLQTEEKQSERLAALSDYDGLLLKRDKQTKGNGYYFVARRETGYKYKYIGKEPNDVIRYTKEARYLKKSLKILNGNIRALRIVLSEMKPYDSESVEKELPSTYQGAILSALNTDSRATEWKNAAEAIKRSYKPFYAEELIHKTDDGTMVRSKSEAIIYNLLLRLGITFVYEYPVRTNRGTRFADFAMLSEVDFKTVILLEHQGMMDNPEYRDRFSTRVYDYLSMGYVPGLNIFYTFDGLDGSINTDPVLDIIKLRIRPSEGN